VQRALVLGLILSLACTSAIAQTREPVEVLDESLFNSEPVEEVPDDSMASPALPPVPPVEQPALKVEPNIIYDTAILQGLKKVTAETSMLEAPIDTPVTFGGLTITVKKCVKSSPEERPENSALILIKDAKPGMEPATVFSGWMFSSSPALSALEHPVYDITMLECVVKKKAPEPSIPAPEKPKKSKKK